MLDAKRLLTFDILRIPFCCTLFPMIAFSTPVMAGSGNALLGWQTFDTTTPGAANSGIDDTTPDTNSTFDATPVGSISPSGHYLTGAIGPSASGTGRNGFGENSNNTFLNGQTFGGNDLMNEAAESVFAWTLADGSPGAQIGGQGTAEASSWKFANSNNQRLGDFSITNHSDYYFRLEFIHFDARVGNANSPDDLDIIYLATPGNLIRKQTGLEVVDLAGVYNTENAALVDFGTAPATINISRGVGEALSSQVFIAPGDSAAFRFRWTGQVNDTAESQIDNLAFEGTFFETADLLNVVDPVSVAEANVPVMPWLLQWVMAGVLGLVSARALVNRR